MNALNLYLLTRATDDLFDSQDYILAHKKEISKFKPHEITTIKKFVELILEDVLIDNLDGFYCSYKIPQIGKEFDLIKLDESNVLNIELKSLPIALDKIKEQLIKNKYYLSALQKEVKLYTFIASTQKVYCLSGDDLVACSLSEIIDSIKIIDKPFKESLDTLFKPSIYLVSPLNTPEKFLDGNYFLTQQQYEIKQKILRFFKSTSGFSFNCVEGKAGTGKTLLLYDIVKTLCEQENKCLIIHCGIISHGQDIIEETIKNLKITIPKFIRYIDFDKYNYIFIDETHRIYNDQLKKLCEQVNINNIQCVFFMDGEQILSNSEKNRNIPKLIGENLPIESTYILSDKIRTNTEISKFIQAIFDLEKRDKYIDNGKIDILYANTIIETKYLIEYYKNNNYTFINFTSSLYKLCISDSFIDLCNGCDTHHVIGQEFDNVIMIMDSNFKYRDNGILVSAFHPNPDYLYVKLLYQGLTRVRNKLAIVIFDNLELYKKISTIFIN